MSDFDKALAEELARFADNSMRDGQQSLDKNRVPGVLTATTIPDYEAFGAAFRKIADQEGLTDLKLPGYEFWGGGEVGQPISMLGENAIATLEAISQQVSNITIKALYRGRQGYGFEPIADDVQKAALKRSFEGGVRELRIFDMMNEWQNLEKAINFAIDIAKDFEDTKIIGDVCYTKPTKDGKMAWEPEDLAHLAVKHAREGANIIEIKDYAGNLQSNKEAEEWMGEEHAHKVSAAYVVKTIREVLDKAGHTDTTLHLHSHGQKPEALDEAIEAGAAVVDVGIGVQSGQYNGFKNTLAFTNMRDILRLRMQKRGFDIDAPEHKDHEIFQALEHLEASVARASEPVMEDRQKQLDILSKVPEKELRYHAMAGGAISALWGLVEKHWTQYGEEKVANMIKGATNDETIVALKEQGILPDEVNTAEDIANKEMHFLIALRLTEELWEIGGAFGTVTPGAKICCEQAAQGVLQILQGKKLPGRGQSAADEINLIDDYKNIFLGRWGRNTGLDAGIGSTVLRDRLLDGQEPALFPPIEGSGMEPAYAFVDTMAEEMEITFGKGNLPSREDAALMAALTKKGGKYNIAEALLKFLHTGERSGAIEPSRTEYDFARTAEDMVNLASVFNEVEEAVGKSTITPAIDEAVRLIMPVKPEKPLEPYTADNLRALAEIFFKDTLEQQGLSGKNLENSLDIAANLLEAHAKSIIDYAHSVAAPVGKNIKVSAEKHIDVAGEKGFILANLADVVGVDALRTVEAVKALHTLTSALDYDKEAATELEANIRAFRAQAKHTMRLIGREAREIRATELEAELTNGGDTQETQERLERIRSRSVPTRVSHTTAHAFDDLVEGMLRHMQHSELTSTYNMATPYPRMISEIINSNAKEYGSLRAKQKTAPTQKRADVLKQQGQNIAEHTRDKLAEHGLTAAEIEELVPTFNRIAVKTMKRPLLPNR